MKKQGHPDYQEILFIDSATGFKFVCGSTLKPKEKEVYQGKEYPVCRVSISSSSHPFFTGSSQLVDAEGRVDKFRKRYARQESAPQEKPKEEQPKAAPKKAAPKKPAKK